MYGNWQDNESSKADASQIRDIMEELRGFRPYLRRRLQYILESNRSLEFQDEVTDIEYYLSVMTDSEADLVHGVEGLRGFVHKLHEMVLRKKVPDDFKFKSEDEHSSSGTSNADDKSQDGEENDVAVGELEKRLKRGKMFQDWRITENLKSFRAPERVSGEPEPAWFTFQKSEHEKKLRGEVTSSTSGVIPSEEQRQISQPVNSPEWLQENADGHLDPLVAAGLEGICERRAKKVDTKPILKNPCLRQNPLYRAPQPFGPGPSQVQYQAPQAATPYLRFPQATAPQPRFPQGPGPYLRFPQAPTPYLPGYSQPANATPSWMFEQSDFTYQPSSYDYSRSAPLDTVRRQPPIVSTYVAGYGHIDIMPPLQSTPPLATPSQPRIRAQLSECQVPRDVRPNPFFNPRHQHQPVMNRQNDHYNDLRVDQRGSRLPAFPTTPAPSVQSFPDNVSPDWENDDNESSMSYGSYKRSQMQKKTVQFQRNTAPVHPPRNRRYFHRDQEQTKRGNFSTANQQQRSPRHNNFKRKSTVRQILEKCQQKMYKLGQHEKIAEDVEEDELRPPSIRSPQQRDSSPSPPPSPKEKDNDLADLVQQAFSKLKSKRELDRLLKDKSALNAILQGNTEIDPPSKQAKKNVKVKAKEKEDVPPVKKVKQQQQKKKKETVADTSKESPSPSKDFNGFSSESEESGSVVSSISTRSATKKRTNQDKSTDSETSCPGTSRNKLPRNMAVKSGSGNKGKGSIPTFNSSEKSPSPQRIRKRITKPLASDSESEIDNDKDEGNASLEDTDAKEHEKPIKRKPSSALIQEVIAEYMSEQSRKKKKKSTEDGPTYWHQKKIVNAQGGQLIRQNDILVNQNLNKIDLGYEYAEAGEGVKQEVKMETDTNDNELELEQMEEGDFIQNFIGNQTTDLECEVVVNEVEEENVEEMPETMVEVLMEATDDCDNENLDLQDTSGQTEL